MKKGIVVLVVIAVVLVIVVGIVLTYNGLIRAENRVNEARAQVGVVCQRRLDLIPNIVETVKGYVKHEKETFLAVTNARTRAQNVLSDFISRQSVNIEDISALSTSQSELGGVLRELLVVVEDYPELKASSNFMALQDQLEGTENRIAVERMRYNSAVRVYNTRIRTFPGSIVAGLFGLAQKDYFEESEETSEPLEIEF
jgi:LemA protein